MFLLPDNRLSRSLPRRRRLPGHWRAAWASGRLPAWDALATDIDGDGFVEVLIGSHFDAFWLEIPVLQSGVTSSGASWIAPPWAEEEDYSGASLSIRESGNGFVLEPRTPSGDLSPGDDSEAGKIIDSK